MDNFLADRECDRPEQPATYCAHEKAYELIFDLWHKMKHECHHPDAQDFAHRALAILKSGKPEDKNVPAV